MGVMGQRTLANYGIHTEQSHYRFHVCFKTGMAYIYKTQNGAQCCDNRFRKVSARQPGVSYATAEGYLVPPARIPGCREMKIPKAFLDRVQCVPTDTTSEKGRKAVWVARMMFLRGMVPLSVSSEEVVAADMQLSGTDIIIKQNARVQVKCDFDGGSAGTGYLFLQVAELNPLRAH